MAESRSLKCPVCGARFRQTTDCRRCGADLEPLMRLAMKAYLAREASRQRLLEGDFESAENLAVLAQDLCATSDGRRLVLLASCLSCVEGEGD